MNAATRTMGPPAARAPGIGRVVSAFAIAATLAAAIPAGPVLAQPASPPASVAATLPDARLAGEGVLRWFGLKVYEARLWTRAGGLDPERFSAAPFALELRYARSLDGASIAQVSHDEIARLGFGDPRRRVEWLDSMRRIFPNVADGDRITGVHRPGSGASFYLNDRQIGAVDDPEFAGAFFAIWLDARTNEPGLRERLLAKSRAVAGSAR